MRNWQIIKKSKYWIGISITLIILSIIAISMFGLKLGTDFTGGAMLTVEFKDVERPSIDQVNQALQEIQIEKAQIQPMAENQYSIKMQSISEETHQQILSKLGEKFGKQNANAPKVEGITADGQVIQLGATDTKSDNIVEQKFDSIGPLIGNELKTKTLWAVLLSLIAITLYIAYVFRHVSMPVESWKYGLAAMIALAHDIVIIVGVFAVLGKFMNVEVDSFFITALLTILGYSVNDTIVTFDRIRENLHKKTNLTFKDLVNVSINETIARSFNTSFTTFIVLAFIFFMGGETVKFFTLALMLGITIGTYSSIFIASPVLIMFYKLKYTKA